MTCDNVVSYIEITMFLKEFPLMFVLFLHGEVNIVKGLLDSKMRIDLIIVCKV